MLKGKTTIELTDVETGETKKYEHENMVTNAVRDFCKSNALYTPAIKYEPFTRWGNIALNMFGGMMLWQNALSLTSADDYFLPTNNACTGYACEIANNTINDKMGSFNATESGEVTNGYRFVWDFATNQANGQISAVSLVPRITGRLGYGLDSAKYDSSLDITDSIFMSSDASSYEPCYPFLFAEDNILYGVKKYNLNYDGNHSSEHISRNGKKLIIRRFRFPSTEINILDKPLVFTNALEDVEITLPSDYTISDSATTYYGFCNYSDGYIYLCIGTSSSGATMSVKICKIDVSDWSCTTFDINATFESSFTWFNQLRPTWSSASQGCFMNYRKNRVANNKLWVSGSPSYFIDFTAPNVAQKVTYVGGSDFNASATDYNDHDGFYSLVGNHLYAVNSSGISALINLDTAKVSLLNAYFNKFKGICYGTGNNSSNYHIPNLDGKFMIVVCGSAYEYSEEMHNVVLPHVMTTKNNLSESVTKTNAQTMKVTYTLTETA